MEIIVGYITIEMNNIKEKERDEMGEINEMVYNL